MGLFSLEKAKGALSNVYKYLMEVVVPTDRTKDSGHKLIVVTKPGYK